MKQLFIFSIITLAVFAAITFSPDAKGMDVAQTIQKTKPEGFPVAVVGGGCFWCLESEFRRIEGVLYTRSGYAGGDVNDPSYRAVTTGTTGHAEAVEITYDPERIAYRDLLDYFLRKGHDPTQLNRQGVDVGPQYRSVIFYTDNEQKRIAMEAIDAAGADKAWKDPIVTTLEPLGTFWEAEEYHQQYYEKYEAKTGEKHIRVLMKEKKR